jgi:hypothetical protein
LPPSEGFEEFEGFEGFEGLLVPPLLDPPFDPSLSVGSVVSV